MACKKLKFTGKDVIVRYAIGCPDQLPLETEWKRMMALRSRGLEITWDTADATDGDSVGALRENIATFQALSISGDGTVKVAGAGAENHREFTKHVAKPDATGGQPVMWLQLIYPDLTFTAFCLVSTLSRTGAYDDVVTYAFEASATASDFGLIVEDTPDADAPDPASIQLVPDTLSMTVGETFDFQGVVLPVGSPQGLRWTSSNPSVASIDQVSGVATALSGGSVTLTAASSVSPGVTETAALTVAPLVAGITVNPSAISVADGATAQITAAVSPVGAAPGLVYESLNPAIATVNSSGLVTGVEQGTTSVRITSAARPSITSTVAVTVTAP
jgi:predicted secreted protein